MTQYPLYGRLNYRGKKKPEINKDLAEQGKEETMTNITRELEYAERIKVLEAENDRLRAEINEQNQIFRVLEKMYGDAFDEQFYCKKCKDSSVDFDYENKLNVIKRIVLEVRCLIHKYTRW